MKRLLLTLIVSLLLTTGTANALDVSQYMLMKDNEATLKTVQSFVYGVANGIEASNTALELDGKKKLYCMDRHLEGPDYMNLLDTTIGLYPFGRVKDLPVESLLLQMLRETFPCKN
ncbi:MAG: hypothetical protein ACN4GW_04790 [Desulforhopalus sp.]